MAQLASQSMKWIQLILNKNYNTDKNVVESAVKNTQRKEIDSLFSVRAHVREKATVARKETSMKFGKGMQRWLRKVETTLNYVQNCNSNESFHEEETKQIEKN